MNWNERYAADRPPRKMVTVRPPREMVTVDPTPPGATPKGRTCDHVPCMKTLEGRNVTRINLDDPDRPAGLKPAYVCSGCVDNFLSGIDTTHLRLQTGLGIEGANTAPSLPPPTLHLKDPDITY